MLINCARANFELLQKETQEFIHTSTVASKFTRFESSWWKYCKRRYT